MFTRGTDGTLTNAFMQSKLTAPFSTVNNLSKPTMEVRRLPVVGEGEGFTQFCDLTIQSQRHWHCLQTSQ